MRLGKQQREILAYLKKCGKPVFSADVVYHLFYRGEEPERGCKGPPRSLFVSVRRSVHKLAEHGLVQIGYILPHLEKNVVLSCWLPEHEAPNHFSRRLSGAKVDRFVLHILEEITDEERKDAWLYYARRRNKVYWRDESKDVPYSYLAKKVSSLLTGNDIHVNHRVAMAVRRSVERLTKQEKISAQYWNANSFAVVRLKDA